MPQYVARLEPDMLRRILGIGVRSALEYCLFHLGRVVVVGMIAPFGTMQTSANAVANTLDSIGLIIGQAMGLAMITVVGRCMGGGRPDQAVRYAKKLMLWVYLAQGASNLLVMVCLPALLGCYRSLSPETEALARTLVLIHTGSALVLCRWPLCCPTPCARRETCALPWWSAPPPCCCGASAFPGFSACVWGMAPWGCGLPWCWTGFAGRRSSWAGSSPGPGSGRN